PIYETRRFRLPRVAVEVPGQVEVVEQLVGAGEFAGCVVDDERDVGLVERAVGAEGRGQDLELLLRFTKNRLLVAEDHQFPDALGHEVEPSGGFRPGEDSFNARETSDDPGRARSVARRPQPDPGGPTEGPVVLDVSVPFGRERVAQVQAAVLAGS